MNFPKYSQLEIERRWLVELAALDFLDNLPYRLIEDLYLQDTRLRLRKISLGDHVEYKLCKKYSKTDALSEPITNLYLNEVEYNLMVGLTGHSSRKRRYKLEQGSLDIYLQPELNYAIFEREFASVQAALDFLPPDFVQQEVTDHPNYSGYALTASDF